MRETPRAHGVEEITGKIRRLSLGDFLGEASKNDEGVNTVSTLPPSAGDHLAHNALG